MNINDLPEDVLSDHLFPYLDLRSRASAELTCRRWRRLLNQVPQRAIGLWVSRRETHYFANTNSHQYTHPAFVYGQLPSAEWDSYSLSPEQAKLFLAKHNRGRSLYVFVSTARDLRNCLDVIQEKWKHLQRLHIECFRFREDAFSIIAGHGVAKLVVQILLTSYCGRDPSISELFRCCTGLETLCIEGHRYDRAETLDQVPPRFRGLFLTENDFADVDRLLGGRLNQLEELGIRSCDGDELKKICENMKNLVTFRFRFTGEASSLWPLGSLVKLTNLGFWSTNTDMDAELVRIISKCPNIKALEVSLDIVSAVVVRALPASTPGLETLTMWGPLDRISGAVQNLDALAQLSNFKTLGVFVPDAHASYLVDFIRSSSSIRNIDILWSDTLHDLLQVFNAMNAKAAANPSARFKLHTRIPQRHLVDISENLTVCCQQLNE